MGNKFTLPIEDNTYSLSRKAIKRKALDQALDQLQFNFKKKTQSNKGVIVHNVELIKCVYCSKRIRIDLMDNHLSIHFTECQYCKGLFLKSDVASLESHILMTHFKYCDIWNNYVLKSKIKPHIDGHNGKESKIYNALYHITYCNIYFIIIAKFLSKFWSWTSICYLVM